MSSYKLIYPSIGTCQSETELCHLFERHARTLLDEKRRMTNEIIEWETNLLRQIRENVNEQQDRLEREYQNQLESLKIKRQEYLDTASIYEQRMNREEVRHLLEQCHALKCQLGSLEYLEQPILFIQLEKEKQQTFDDKKIEENTNLSSSTSTTSNQTNRQLYATPTSASNDYYATNQNVLNLTVIDNDDTGDKCPACLMIFPPEMGTNERSQHVNQHFGD